MALKQNMKLLIDNHADVAAVTAIPALEPTLHEGFLKKISRSQHARTTSTAAQTFKFNWTTRKLFNGFALCRVKGLSILCQVHLTLYSGENQTGTVVFDSIFKGIPAKGWGEFKWGEPWGSSIFTGKEDRAFISLWFDTVMAKSASLTISDSSPLGSYFDFGRLYLGFALTPNYNFTEGMTCTPNDTTEQVKMESGIIRSYKSQIPSRVLNFSLDWLSNRERPAFFDWAINHGKADDIFICMFPDSAGANYVDYSFPAKSTDSIPFSLPMFDNWKSSYKFEET